VPNAWNATDESVESFTGGVGWYRKDFRLPSAARRLAWVVRFESVNYRSRIWLNGRPLGSHKGAYLPFELRLPAGVLTARARTAWCPWTTAGWPTDFPPVGPLGPRHPDGRLVELRRAPARGLPAQGRHRGLLHRPGPPGARLLDVPGHRGRAHHAAQLLGPPRTGPRVGPLRQPAPEPRRQGRRRPALRHVHPTIRIARPRLWAPGSPNLYDVDLRARVGDRLAQRYSLRSGIRSVKVSGGKLLLNGRELDFRGVGLHEDDGQRGFAIDNGIRRRVAAEAQELGATMLRSHYPLHPYTHELADRLGLMVWSEIPVYALKTRQLSKAVVRRMAARELEKNILTNQNHASIVTWSVGNELSARPGPVQGMYLRDAAASAKRLDPTRPCRTPSRATRPRAARTSTGRSTCSGSTSTSAGTPARAAPSPTAPS
jgi:beta-glucuronidase